MGLIPGPGSSPGEGNGNPLQYPCLEDPMDRGAWWATAHGVTRVGLSNQTTTICIYGHILVKNAPGNAETEDGGLILGGEDPLQEEMAIHSSILAWKIPWTEEPGGLQSIGSQRVGHD